MNFDDIHTPIPAFLFAGDMYILIESLFPQTKRHVDPRIGELVNVYSQNLDDCEISGVFNRVKSKNLNLGSSSNEYRDELMLCSCSACAFGELCIHS